MPAATAVRRATARRSPARNRRQTPVDIGRTLPCLRTEGRELSRRESGHEGSPPPARHLHFGGAQPGPVMSSLLHGVLGLHGWPAYLVVGALCFGEASFFLGFVLPGETAVVFGGVLASFHHVSLVKMLLLIVFCAGAGDSVGYEVGRHFGPALIRRLPSKARRGAEQSQDFLQRRGGPAIFVGRFTALFRAVIPGVAGMSGMRYRTFLLWNALGGICWGTAFTLAGYFAGKSYERVISVAGTASTVVISLVVLTIATVVVRRKVREHRKADPHPPADSPDP
jgi:membrane-associated protein